jgi:hypothetical protein
MAFMMLAILKRELTMCWLDVRGNCALGKRISSRIRGVVSAVSFDNFHKNSTEII